MNSLGPGGRSPRCYRLPRLTLGNEVFDLDFEL